MKFPCRPTGIVTFWLTPKKKCFGASFCGKRVSGDLYRRSHRLEWSRWASDRASCPEYCAWSWEGPTRPRCGNTRSQTCRAAPTRTSPSCICKAKSPHMHYSMFSEHRIQGEQAIGTLDWYYALIDQIDHIKSWSHSVHWSGSFCNRCCFADLLFCAFMHRRMSHYLVRNIRTFSHTVRTHKIIKFREYAKTVVWHLVNPKTTTSYSTELFCY